MQLAGYFTYMDRCHTVIGDGRVSLLTWWTTISVVQMKGFLMNLSLPICLIHVHVYIGIKYYQNHNFQSHATETLKTPWSLRTQDIDSSIAVTHRTQFPLITLAWVLSFFFFFTLITFTYSKFQVFNLKKVFFLFFSEFRLKKKCS